MQSLSSKLLEKAVEQFASLPGIGRKTALRYVLHMLRQSPEEDKTIYRQHYRLKRIHQGVHALPQHFRQRHL